MADEDDGPRQRSQSESAGWINVQKNTFTNWCNDRLKDTGLKVVDLASQFDDGITLLKLLEVLAYYNKSKLKYKKNPKLPVQKTENLAMAFDFMKKVEKIELVNIGPQDINEHNLKLMLGLVWTLIQRYQLGIGAPEEERSPPPQAAATAATPGAKAAPKEKKPKEKKKPSQSAKAILLGWVNATLPDIGVKNFTTDWNDGRKISALVDSMKPGLIPDHATLNPDDRLENTSRALDLAEEHFGVPQIIAAKDMCVPRPDELSVLTYIGYYCNRESVGKNSLLDWINSKIPKYNISDFTGSWKDGMALGCLTDVISGGQFPDYEDMTPETPLENVQTSMDYAQDSLGVPKVITPEQFVDPTLDPVTMMTYLTGFKYAKPSGNSLANITATGPGISGAKAGKDTSFVIRGRIPEWAPLDVNITGPDGSKVPIEKLDPIANSCPFRYKPTLPGKYTVEVLVNKEHIHGSPFSLHHSEPANAGGCTATGEGLSKAIVGEKAEFTVDASEGGPGQLQVDLKGPKGNLGTEITATSGNVYNVGFVPIEAGPHTISAMWAGSHIDKSPFTVRVIDPKKVTATGPGLTGATVNQPAVFYVKTKDAGQSTLSVNVSGPNGSKVPVKIHENEPESYMCSFTPLESGNHIIDARWEDVPITGSPFHMSSTVPADASKCKVNNLPTGYLRAGKEVNFSVDVSDAGDGLVKASGQGPSLPQKCSVRSLDSNSFEVSFSPFEVGKLNTDVTFAEQPIPGSPFTFNVNDPSKCRINSAALKEGEYMVKQPIDFRVSAQFCGEGKVTAKLHGPKGEEDIKVTDNNDGTYLVHFTPTVPGSHSFDVFFDGEEIPDAPVNLFVNAGSGSDDVIVKQPAADRRGVFVVDTPHDYKINSSNANDGQLSASCVGVFTGHKPTVDVKEVGSKDFIVSINTSVPDDYKVSILWSNDPVPGSPFSLTVVDKARPDKVIIRGPSFNFTSPAIAFNADVKDAGVGELLASCRGNRVGSVPVSIKETGPKLYQLDLEPSYPDKFTISILWDGEHVPGSPFKVDNTPPDASKVIVTKPDSFATSVSAVFNVDATDAGVGSLKAHCRAENSANLPVEIVKPDPDVEKYRCSITPIRNDIYHLSLLWSDKEVPGSPFKIDLVPKFHSDLVIVEDPVYSDTEHPVTVNVDCSNAGSGKLTARCKGEASGPVPVSIAETEPGKYKLEFQPPREDDYKLNILFNNEEVPRSPFSFVIADKARPDKVVIRGPSFDFTSPRITLNADVKDAGGGKLSASCRGNRVGSVPVDIKETGPKLYQMNINPPQPDQFTINALWNDEHVPGSPFKVDNTPPDASKVIVTKPDSFATSVPAVFNVDATDAGVGSLKAHCRAENSANLPVEIVKPDPDVEKYRCSITPIRDDIYHLSLLWSDKEVPGSPFKIDLVPKFHSDLVIVEDPVYSDTEHPVTVNVDCSNAGSGKLTARCKGEASGPVPVSIAETEPGKYKLEFQPPREDDYKLNILFNNEEAPRSPFSLSIADKARPDKVVIRGPSFDFTSPRITLNADVKDAGGGKLSASCRGNRVGSIPVDIKETGPKLYQMNINPPQPDQFTINALWNDEHVPGSPFKVDNTPPDASKVIVTKPDSFATSVRANFRVNATDAGVGSLKAHCKAKNSANLPVEIVKPDPDVEKYRCSITPIRDDVYHLSLLWSDKEVPGSPFKIDLVPKIHADQVVVDDPVYSGIDDPVTVNVDCSNAGSGKLAARCKGDISGSVPVSVAETEPGKYKLEFQPPRADDYKLNIFFDKEEVPRSPLDISIHPIVEPLAEFVMIEEEHHEFPLFSDLAPLPDDEAAPRSPTPPPPEPMYLFLGQPFHVDVETDVDASPEITATAEGDNNGTAPISVVKKGNGDYSIDFQPTKPDRYVVSIKQDGKEAPNSPLIIYYSTPVDASKCIIIDLEKVPFYPMIDDDIGFGLDATEAGKGDLKVTADGPSGTNSSRIRVVSDTDQPGVYREGIYRIYYTPTAPGEHRVHLQWGDNMVPGCPLVFNVVSGSAITGDKLYPFGSPIALGVAADCKPKDLEAFAVHNGDKQKIKVSKDKKPGQYRLSWQPTDPGTYDVHVLLKGKEVAGSPYQVQYSDPPQPSKVKVDIDQHDHAYVNYPITFSIDTRDAGKAELLLRANIAKKLKEKTPDFVIRKNDDGTYSATYTPSQPVQHSFEVLFAGQPVKGSPFKLSVTEKPLDLSHVLASNLNLMEVHKAVDVYFDLPVGDSISTVTASATGKTIEDADFKLQAIDDDNNTYRAHFVPSSPDDYQLELMHKNVPVMGSPFPVKVVGLGGFEPSSSPDDIDNPPIVEAKRPFTLLLPLDINASPEEFNVDIDGPPESSVPPVEVKGDKRGCYSVTLTPDLPGHYLIHVTKEETPVRGSPFRIIVKEFRSDPTKCFIVPEDQPLFEKTQRFGKPCSFRISTIDAGPGTLNITSRGPGKADVKIFDNNDGTYTCEFSPSLPGQYGIDILWDEQHIGESPYTLKFKEKKKKVITGINLDAENFRVGVPHRFKLHCDEVGEGKLEVSVKPPSAAQIRVSDIGNDSYQVEILPQEQGNHEISVQYGNGHILGSPFNVVFNEKGDASKCHMISNEVLQDEEGQDHVVFIISTEGAGKGKLSAHADNPHSGERLSVMIDEIEQDKYKVHFDIGDGAEYQLTVKYDTVHIEGSPFKLLFADQVDASVCQADGDGLTVSHVDKEAKFTVLTEGGGDGELSVDIKAEDGTRVHPHISQINEVEYEVTYSPSVSGKYQVIVKWGDDHIPDSPFAMKCYVPLHASNLSVVDPPSEGYLEKALVFKVITVQEMEEEGELAVIGKSRSATIEGKVMKEDDGSYTCSLEPTVAAKYIVKVTLNGENIKNSPFKVKVSEPPKPENVKASGPGLEDGYVGQEGNFMLETETAGTGTLSVRVHGPKGAFRINMRRHPDNDRNILVRYDPKYAGKYSIDVTWSEVHIPGSPFKVQIFEQKDGAERIDENEEAEQVGGEKEEMSLTNAVEESLVSSKENIYVT